MTEQPKKISEQIRDRDECADCEHGADRHYIRELPKGTSVLGACAAGSCDCREFVPKEASTSVGTTGHAIDPEGVAHPAHYNQDPSGVECIDIVRWRNFNVGNAIKYLWRAGLKAGTDEEPKAKQINDLKKAIFYIQDEIKRIEGE